MRGKKKGKWKKAQISCVIILALLVMHSSQNISSPSSPVNNSSSPNSTFPSATPSAPPLNISAPSIVSFEPKSMIVCDYESERRTFSISTDQVVDVRWLINGTEIQVNKSVINASYTKNATFGIWNVSAIAFNKNGTVIHTWIWKVSQNFTNRTNRTNLTTPSPTQPITQTPTPSSSPPTHSPPPTPKLSPQSKPTQKKTHTITAPFYIFGWVYYDKEKCYNPIVIVSNGKNKWHAETYSNFFHLFITNISEGDILEFNVSDGNQYNITEFVVTHEDIEKGGIFNVNLTLKSPTQTDLAVTKLWIEQPEIIIGDVVNVTAEIKNRGKSTCATTIFYDEKNISIFKFYWNVPNFTNKGNDIIVQPEALKIRIHFIELGIQDGGYVKIYDKKDDLIHNFTVDAGDFNITDFWTNWSEGDEIRIESNARNYLYFMIDKYEAIFGNETQRLGSGQSSKFTARWNASAWFNDEDIASGNHTIRVRVMPLPNESNVENNEMSRTICVKPARIDIQVKNLFVDKETLLDGDVVNITAVITNNGYEDVSELKIMFIDEENERKECFSETTIHNLKAGSSATIPTVWNATYGNHTITVIADPDDVIPELNETNNQRNIQVYVRKSRDFSLTSVELFNESGKINASDLFLGEKLVVKALLNITNFANRGGETNVCLFMNDNLLDNATVVFGKGNETKYVVFNLTIDRAGNHTLNVCVDCNDTIKEFDETNNCKSINICVHKGNDFAVTNITFRPEPLIGDVIEVNATIANFGSREGSTIVEFYDSKDVNIMRTLEDYERFGKDKIKDVIKIPGAHRIRVHFSYVEEGFVKILDGNNTEVEALSSKRDIWTKWVSGDIIQIESQWAEFLIDKYEAVIESRNISISAKSCENISAKWDLSDQYMGHIFLGTHNLTVKVDPYNDIDELDEENNTLTKRIYVGASVDFAVENISFSSKEPILGDIVKINATIKNYGVKNGKTSVEIFYDNRTAEIKRAGYYTNITLPEGVIGAKLHFSRITSASGVIICDEEGNFIERIYDPGWTSYIYSDVIILKSLEGDFEIDRYEAVIKNETIELNASESKIISAIWNATKIYGGAGDHDITVRIDPNNEYAEINEENNTRIQHIFVNGTDFAVIDIEIPYSPENPLYEGKVVNVTAKVANFGAISAHNTVIFKDGIGLDNKSGVIFAKKNINLSSGEIKKINVSWNVMYGGDEYHTITVTIPFDNTDNNRTNNCLWENTLLPAYYGIDFSVENISAYPREVREGEYVNITVVVGNLGYKSGDVDIGFFINYTDFAASNQERFERIGTIRSIHLEPGEKRNVSFEWRANIHGGTHSIIAVVDPDDKYDEDDDIREVRDSIIFVGDTGNNVKRCIIHVIPADISILNLTIEPDEPEIGDIVNIIAHVKNENVSESADSLLKFYVEREISESWSSCSWESTQLSLSLLQPEDSLMRIHFDHIRFNLTEEWQRSAEVYCYVRDSKGNLKPVHFYVRKEGGNQMIPVLNISWETKEGCSCYNKSGYHVNCTNESVKYKCWEDIWTDFAYGNELVVIAKGDLKSFGDGETELLIDKYQLLLGNKTLSLRPGESKPYNATWNASLPPGGYPIIVEGYPTLDDKKKREVRLLSGNYTIIVVSNNYIRDKIYKVFLGGTDLVVTNVSVNGVVWGEESPSFEVNDGDIVEINATISNFGRLNASNFTVRFCDVLEDVGKEKIIEEKNVSLLESGKSMNFSMLWNASLRTKIGSEYYDSYNHTIRVEIVTRKELEEDIANNEVSVPIYVKKSRNFAIVNLSFGIDNKTYCPDSGRVYLELGGNVTINATLNITNHANRGGVVNVSFYVDEVEVGKEIGSKIVEFEANITNKTKYAEITWEVEGIVGDHNIIVIVDSDNRTIEFNESDNKLIQKIHVSASDLLIERLEVCPENPMKGEDVSINITVANRGNKDESNVTLGVYELRGRRMEDVDYDIGVYNGSRSMQITRSNATAMRLYLDLDIKKGGKVCINDSDSVIVCYDEVFHGWSPWIIGNKTEIIVNGNESHVQAMVSKIYYLNRSEEIKRISIGNLTVNTTADINITINTTNMAEGEQLIEVRVDPENDITEYNELNNRKAELISVQTADMVDISVSINKTQEIIRHGDELRIEANITNIGIKEARNVSVRFLIDNIPINITSIPILHRNESLKTNWTAIVGEHTIKVEVDYDDRITEKNETNNIDALDIYVFGAVMKGNTSWETLGLHGEILFGPEQPYDEDTVNVTANITNTGYVNATDFNVILFFNALEYIDIKGKRRERINKSYEGAKCVYLNIIDRVEEERRVENPLKEHIKIYDKFSNPVLNETIFDELCWINDRMNRIKSCWVGVEGDAVNIFINSLQFSEDFIIYFYPIYQNNTSRLYEVESLPINSSIILHPPIKRNVSTGNYLITLIIDPECVIPEDEDDKVDNIISRTMHVLPTRDFSVINVTLDRKTNLSDLDRINITAEVANLGMRNGTTEVEFIDYENESEIFEYYFNKSIPSLYIPIPPDTGLWRNSTTKWTIIHRPGADAILLHFNRIIVGGESWGEMRIYTNIYDEGRRGDEIWGIEGSKGSAPFEEKNYDISVPGDTVYIKTEGSASFELREYTTVKLIKSKNVTLNATKTLNESKNVITNWTVLAGNHTITVKIDPKDRICEINESNNTFSVPLGVKATRDPLIENITFHPEHPKGGDNVTISVKIRNNGTERAEFRFDLWMNIAKNADAPPPENSIRKIRNEENRTSYIILLKNVNLSLKPNESIIVNATYHNISVFGDPIYEVIAIVDPLNEIREIYESNNKLVREIIMDYPDLTVSGFVSPSREDNNAYVRVDNVGIKNATNVSVRFELSKYKPIEIRGSKRGFMEVPEGGIEGASNIRVHFGFVDAKGGWLEVKKDWRDKEALWKCSGEVCEGWTPWVEGDRVWVVWSLKEGSFLIDAIEWGEVNTTMIDSVNRSESALIKIPDEWMIYDQPKRIKVIVDPYNNITELREDNNSRTGTIYIDLVAENITFVYPRYVLCLDTETNIIDVTIRNGERNADNIVLPASNFNISLRVKYLNGTPYKQSYELTYTELLYAGETDNITFTLGKIYPPFKGFSEEYIVSAVVDANNNIIEGNDFYPWGEGNNEIEMQVTVSQTNGYKAKEIPLKNVAHGKLYGNIIYDIGNSRYSNSSEWEKPYSIDFDLPHINADDVEMARLYLYWLTWQKLETPSIDMEFNGKKVVYINNINDQNYFDDVQYVDIKGEEYIFKHRYGVYVYDVTEEVRDAIKSQESLEAVAYRKEEAGLAGMLLLIIYKDSSAPLMEYWINEGVDVIWANEEKDTKPEQCIVRAPFNTSLDKDKVGDAKLFTVLSSSSENSEHALLFNNEEVAVDAWRERGDDCIALTEPDEWVDVKNELSGQGDEAEFQSRGDYMTVTNAILKVTYLPDLTVSLESFPSSVKAGTTHTIKVRVSNLGESKAENFIMRLKASKGTVTPSEQTIKLLNGTYEGNNTVTVDFKWTAPKLAMPSSEYIQRVEENVNISVEVDPYNMVDELNENNNADDITVTVWDVLTRNPELRPPGGGGAGGGTGTGFGTGNKSGREAVAFGGAPAESEETGKGKEVKEESHAKTLWGYLLRKILVPGEEKAGGSSGFLLWEYLIKVSAFLIGIAFLVLGYLFERRRHNAAKHVRKERKSRGESER